MFKRKSKGKTIGIIALCILLGVALCSIVGKITDGFTDFDIRSLNEDNLLSVEDYAEGLDEKRDDGLTVTVSEKGVITVEGENETEADVKIAVQDVTLDTGKYTISSDAKGVKDDTYYLCIVNGDKTIIADTEDDSTFTIFADDTTCTVYIVVCAGETVDATFKPVLVEGSEAGSFYVIG